MPVPDVILQLVQRFEDHKNSYRSPRYNEAQLRQEFLNPLIKAQGFLFVLREALIAFNRR